MKSQRGIALTLMNVTGKSNHDSTSNYISLSPQHKINQQQCIIRFATNHFNPIDELAAATICYPVVYDADLARDQMIIPRDIRTALHLELQRNFVCALDVIGDDEWVPVSAIEFIIKDVRGGMLREPVAAMELAAAVRALLVGRSEKFPLQVGQMIILPLGQVRLCLSVQAINADDAATDSEHQFAYLTDLSELHFMNEKSCLVKLTGEYQPVPAATDKLAAIPLDFVGRGIGGLKKEMAQIIRSALLTRIMQPAMLQAYGVKKHVMGMLLSGPPGSGKTLIAKCIAGLFSKEAVIFVEGPQLKSSYYGATQQNLANLFVGARRHPGQLYVIIFDEMDVVFPVRGADSSVSTANSNDLTSRMLSILDGPDSPDNVFIIGTTNRKELIDPAILRAGRMSLQLEIGFPDEGGRLEILQIHTRDMTQTLAADVDLSELARLTNNYSGAELAMLVDEARKLAIEKNYTESNNQLCLRDNVIAIADVEKVSRQYFLQALQAMKPQAGHDETLAAINHQAFVSYHEDIARTVRDFTVSVAALRAGKQVQPLNYLISGGPGSGTTRLAAHLVAVAGFAHVHMLTAEKLIPFVLSRQLEIMDDILARIRHSTGPGVIILDDLEDLLAATPDCRQFDNRLLMKIAALLRRTTVDEHPLVIMATTKKAEFIQQLGLGNYFHEQQAVPNITLDSTQPEWCRQVLNQFISSQRVINDMPAANHDVMCMPVRDMLYHLHKYVSVTGAVNEISLSGFFAALPERYRVNQQRAPQLEDVTVRKFALFN